MIVPLGVLAIGAILAGMVWYQDFFGETHDVVLPHARGRGAGATKAPPDTSPAEGADHAPVGAVNTAVPPPVGGAIYMHPDNHVMHSRPRIARLGQGVAVHRDADRLPGRVGDVYPGAVGAGATGRDAGAAVPVPAQQVVLRRAVRLGLRAPARWLGRALWQGGDGRTIDGAINGLAMGLIPRLTRFAGRVQSGYLFHYAFGMVLGLVGLLIWVTMRGLN